MKTGDALRSGFILANQKFRLFAVDLLWKFLHFTATLMLILAVTAGLAWWIGNLQWQGPELTPSNPIVLGMVLSELWTEYSATLEWAFAGVVLGILLLWIALEAYFRGGAGHFWLYSGSRLASLAIMGAATALFAVLTTREGLQAGIIFLIVLPPFWCFVTLMETLVRRDAVQLLATDLKVVLAATGSLVGIHLCLAAASLATVSLAFSLMLHASRPPQFLAAAFLMMVTVLAWTIIHSYLVVVRYSTIDIMRDNVVDF